LARAARTQVALTDTLASGCLGLGHIDSHVARAVTTPWLCNATCCGERVELTEDLLRTPRVAGAGPVCPTTSATIALLCSGTRTRGVPAWHGVVVHSVGVFAGRGCALGVSLQGVGVRLVCPCRWRPCFLEKWFHSGRPCFLFCAFLVFLAVVEDVMVSASRTVTGGDSYAQCNALFGCPELVFIARCGAVRW
jgi:hypothetical protein